MALPKHAEYYAQDTYYKSTNPATGETLEHYRMQSMQEANKVVDKAYEAFLTWRDTPLDRRADTIRKIAALLKDNKEELATLMTKEMGKPIAQSRAEVDFCVQICEYTAKEGPEKLQDEKRKVEGGTGIITYQPIGVILAVEPWNFPLYQAIRYSIPNLLAGNTSVLKHAQIVWGTAQRLKEIYEEAGVPEGGLGVTFIDHDQFAKLIEHPNVRGVTLTGSAKAGSAVAKKAGEQLKKAVLELGGSDPYIILEDVDMDSIIDTCVEARVNNSGQTCICAKRFIVVESRYEEFREKFIEAMSKVTYGDPMDEDNRMGPLSRADLRDDLHEQVQASIEKGAVCSLGGEIPEGIGNYYPATVLENVKPGMPAYDDELFGPVASLIKVADEHEAITVANDHKYGLGGGVFTSDVKRGTEIARTKIQSGMVNVNGYNLALPNMPFGGVKDSGFGREHGGFGLLEFVNIKSVIVNDG